MPVYVLGTHTSHDGSACLLKDGEIAVAIEKERVSRIKHHGGNDNDAVSYCLQAAGIDLDDVELVVQNANFDMFERRNPVRLGADRLVERARRVVTISHHLAHMFSAVATAPFEEMACLIIDGCGNSYSDCIDKDGALIPERPPTRELEQLYFEKDSYYHYADGKWRTLYKDFSPGALRQGYPMQPDVTMHSIGGAYAAVSQYVFRGMEDPGKLMGLAPYGRPDIFKGEMFSLRAGRVFLNYDWMAEFDRPALDANDFKNNFQYYADVAWWAQRQVEQAILYVVEQRYEQHPADYLAYAGGVALNAVANSLVRRKSRFKDVYIQPAAADNGLAIGCAFYGWLHLLEGRRRPHSGSSHFGRRYTAGEIESTLSEHGARLQFTQERNILDITADLLAKGKVVGWFQEGSEFGPRALGHRSLLALPTRAEVRDFINASIKFREDFRPFAPSVLAEDVTLYFEQDYPSPYMILVAPTREEWRARIPAVVHRDGTARIQTVHKAITPVYYALLEAVKRRTGLSVLLNTSFNKRGMPIVETPLDAVSMFLETAMDALVIENYLVLKKAQPVIAQQTLDLHAMLHKVCELAARDERRSASLGVIRFVVTGIEQVWTLDFSGRPKIASGGLAVPDHTLVIAATALAELLRDPGVLRTLFENGQVQVPGLNRETSPPEVLLALRDKMHYLVGLMRSE
ncbi:MAG TPA: carbamoyltransferase C-terminal domain-containing protein [Steroidobacteraceae bacterium]